MRATHSADAGSDHHRHHRNHGRSSGRWFRCASLFLAIAAAVWLILRSGRKPSRLAYPCQRAALDAFAVTLVLPLLQFLRGTVAGTPTGATRIMVPIVAMGFLAFGLADSSSTPPAGRFAQLEPPADYVARVYVNEDADGPAGEHHRGLDDLITCMGADGLAFYRTFREGPEAGPTGVVGSGDIVLIKVNQQWDQRGGTNTDVLKGLVTRILEHPDGFWGEIVVIENTQGRGTLDWTLSNAADTRQSVQDVVDHFFTMGRPVSAFLLDPIRTTSVQEFDEGDARNGYVVGPWQPGPQIRVSYPKFRTAGGHYVSLKNGVWDPSTNSYDSDRLTFINVATLKCHGAVYGVTGALKNHVGTMTVGLSTNTHYAVQTGGLGIFLAQVRMPDLNILDCIYVLARPDEGPWCNYDRATRLDKLVAGRDAAAIDLWATHHILVPAIVANGYGSYPMQDPGDAGSIFRQYLDRTVNAMLAAGIATTNDTSQIEAVFTGAEIIPPEVGTLVTPPCFAQPNPFTSSTMLTFTSASQRDLEVLIYDASGRLLRKVLKSTTSGDQEQFYWDGRDETGRTVPPGTYYYRLAAPAAPPVGRVTRLR